MFSSYREQIYGDIEIIVYDIQQTYINSATVCEETDESVADED